MTREDTVKEFHEAFGLGVGSGFVSPLIHLRADLLCEESNELYAELDSATYYTDRNRRIPDHRLDKLLKEMADVQYVLSGLAVTFGLDLDEAFKRVHESNMSKLGEDGKPIYREDGKVLKGPNYKEPDLSDLVEHLV